MMLAFLTNKVPFFSYISILYIFYSDYGKYTLFVIFTKNKVTYDSESKNMWILADEACRFINFSNITS